MSSRAYWITLLASGAAAAALALSWPSLASPWVGAAIGGLLSALVLRAVVLRVHDGGSRAWRLAAVLAGYAALLVLFAALWAYRPAQFVLFMLSAGGGLVILFGLFLVGVLNPTRTPNPFGPVPLWTPPMKARVTSTEPLGEEAARVMRRMRRRRLTTLLMVPSSEAPFSKLGGAPELDAAVPWPTSLRGEALPFLAQLDLAEARAQGGPEWLPAEGFLYVFAPGAGWSRGDWAVIHRSDRASPRDDGTSKPFTERRIDFTPAPSLPSLDWLDIDLETLDVEGHDLDRLAEMPDEHLPEDQPHHRIAGYPGEIQSGPMALICQLESDGQDWERILKETAPDILTKAHARAARRWRLLLQIDSDDALKMSWGDRGRLYFFVPEREARAGDFSAVWMIWQCH